MTRLSAARLPQVPAPFETPGFDRQRVTPGIVHIGLGGFHRAHMARYTHDVMGIDETALQWGIVGAGLRDADKPLIETLASQDCLYSLTEREGATEQRVIIGSIVAALDASRSSDALLAAIDDPLIRIVSMTVTENGYCLDPASKMLDLSHPGIAADLADPRHPGTLPGILVEAYRRRRLANAGAFTALSCDNIQHNGNVLRRAVLALAQAVDPELSAWIAADARFPNSMVDRITPIPIGDDQTTFAVLTGMEDGAAMHSELFRQWVIEDDFVAGRPAWETVGVQFVADVAPYEFMKLRLLNGSHLAIAALGQLMGYGLISETIADPLIRRYMAALMERETGQTLMPVPGIDLPRYKQDLFGRFANPAIRDTTQRVNTDAPVNVLIDPIRDQLAAGRPIDLLALGLAAWLRRAAGNGEDGQPITVVHPLAGLLATRARLGGPDPASLLSITQIFGTLGQDPRLEANLRRWLALIYDRGVQATLAIAESEGLL